MLLPITSSIVWLASMPETAALSERIMGRSYFRFGGSGSGGSGGGRSQGDAGDAAQRSGLVTDLEHGSRGADADAAHQARDDGAVRCCGRDVLADERGRGHRSLGSGRRGLLLLDLAQR